MRRVWWITAAAAEPKALPGLRWTRLAALPAAQLRQLEREARKQIAVLINAYNALTRVAIIEHDPLKATSADILGGGNLEPHSVAGSR